MAQGVKFHLTVSSSLKVQREFISYVKYDNMMMT